MWSIFSFNDKASFLSEESEAFAEVLLRSDPDIRRCVLKGFGLTIELKADPPRISHDGIRIGMGSFETEDGSSVHFTISPKTDAVALRNIYKALANSSVQFQHARFESLSEIAPAEDAPDGFTPAYLLSLLNEIADSARHLLGTIFEKKQLRVRGGIRGRPILVPSFTSMRLGRGIAFACDVLDDRGLRDYAVVLLGTAQSIVELLRDWGRLVGDRAEVELAKMRFISSRFGLWDTSAFSASTLYKICRPPFPYGLREVLYRCLRYWQWRQGIHMAEPGSATFRYYHLVVNLAKLFELYVSESWSLSAAPDFRTLDAGPYQYGIDGIDGISEERRIEPDHFLLNASKKILVVIDAKYRDDVGASGQVQQIVAYTSFCYENSGSLSGFIGEREASRKVVGVLVYPASDWQVGRVTGFSQPIYCIRMPVNSTLLNPRIKEFLTEVVTQIDVQDIQLKGAMQS